MLRLFCCHVDNCAVIILADTGVLPWYTIHTNGKGLHVDIQLCLGRQCQGRAIVAALDALGNTGSKYHAGRFAAFAAIGLWQAF